ncbi:triose-phosphate isomerase [Amycolatopsis albispora]|uniref:Triosephosphate isomerase n=1 Tax=Amycolatopsis albispora TaxID=1804986 RepID=A0A344LJH0_9PSEU|nr:triose-phosphate isomerase [Amycolatopsis albispora]AXB48194.1 triose-phosphate isomerase [Amycolatopsis albispora]
MTKTLAEARSYAQTVRQALGDGGIPGVQPFVCPPATALAEVARVFRGSPVLVGAQNAHWADGGAWTGELSVPQVADAGADLVEIGHSERREHFAETDEVVRRKVDAALRHGLIALLCCGEPASTFAAGRSVPHVLAQVESALGGVNDVEDLSRVVIAYEPVWAIGEHGRPAEPAEVAEVHAALADRWPGVRAVLHGGSVNRVNAPRLLELPGVDGVFVGRAAWRAEGFLELLDLARRETAERR